MVLSVREVDTMMNSTWTLPLFWDFQLSVESMFLFRSIPPSNIHICIYAHGGYVMPLTSCPQHYASKMEHKARQTWLSNPKCIAHTIRNLIQNLIRTLSLLVGLTNLVIPIRYVHNQKNLEFFDVASNHGKCFVLWQNQGLQVQMKYFLG